MQQKRHSRYFSEFMSVLQMLIATQYCFLLSIFLGRDWMVVVATYLFKALSYSILLYAMYMAWNRIGFGSEFRRDSALDCFFDWNFFILKKLRAKVELFWVSWVWLFFCWKDFVHSCSAFRAGSFHCFAAFFSEADFLCACSEITLFFTFYAVTLHVLRGLMIKYVFCVW